MASQSLAKRSPRDLIDRALPQIETFRVLVYNLGMEWVIQKAIALRCRARTVLQHGTNILKSI